MQGRQQRAGRHVRRTHWLLGVDDVSQAAPSDAFVHCAAPRCSTLQIPIPSSSAAVISLRSNHSLSRSVLLFLTLPFTTKTNLGPFTQYQQHLSDSFIFYREEFLRFIFYYYEDRKKRLLSLVLF